MLSVVRKSAGAGLGGHRGRRIIVTATAALLLLPIEASDAGWLSDIFKGSKSNKPPKHSVAPKQAAEPRRAKPAKPAPSPKPRAEKLAVAKPAAPNPAAAKPVTTRCEPPKFRIVIDVGHTAESEGAISARNVAEFVFNLRLAKRIEAQLKADGFAGTRLLVTEGKARRSLVTRVNAANNLAPNLLLSIHHDSVPDKFLEDWEFEGQKRHYSDRFSGYSVFVSRDNPDFQTSLAFAELLAREMKAQGLTYAKQYSQPIMGRFQHPLLNKETGVYSYDQLIVLRKTKMAAVLLESGSIINREEELKMDSDEHRNVVSHGVATAVKEFCDSRWAILGPL
ncbi:N-acetylmuramoyl-L-alanine amidase [Bradyrhizobium lablabi]|uniref:N-acetylmuramoyl-L-alanine amidase n=2 Tax=Bradyrhizobium TaxID=374 RepID=A0ABY0PS84_9BRAD|nr:N-acetylmuramoyl-L-alanine amidase [Bradyrhizobium ottawaense]SED12661.1 N-acetylmuramoyl-L-alanine amidase [Bradyrhizobium lablabi]SHL18471.1 N-acetylmuramoyl-L-alanine amidase [Bradyrhizobium lablabi]